MNAYNVTFRSDLGQMTVKVHADDREGAQEAAIDMMEEIGEPHGDIVGISRAERALPLLPY